MSEPFSGAAGAAFGWKLLGGLAGMGAIGAGLAAVVVMCLMEPRNRKEWAVALISTLVSSVGGGAFVIQHFELAAWAFSPFGLVAMIGLVFACGLPGWAAVRWLFNYINKRRDADLAEVVTEVRNIV